MQEMSREVLPVQPGMIRSSILERDVKLDYYFPPRNTDQAPSLLLINDGQNMDEMGLQPILEALYERNAIRPVLCVGLHAGENRKREYGIASEPDYLNRGDLAGAYSQFVMGELMPSIVDQFEIDKFETTGFAGFSLGGVSALDIVWNHPGQFDVAGVFSGSLWWRRLAQEDPGYSDDEHRIMHTMIRNSDPRPGLRFYLQCGNMDETKDRNQNGIIDSIDDTLGLIRELEAKGYQLGKDIHYREVVDGKHDVATWGRSMPEFLQWAFPIGKI